MGMINIKGLAEAKGEIFKTIPPCTVRCRVTNIKDAVTSEKSKNPGSPMWNITCKVTEGEDNAGHTLFHRLMVPSNDMQPDEYQQAVERIKYFCVACGLPIDSDEFDSQDFMSQEFRAVVTEETWEGKVKNNIKDTLPIED